MGKKSSACIVFAMAIPTPAIADSFVRDAGEGRVIVNAILTDSPRGFDANGNVVNIDDYDQDQVFATLEYGITDNLTVILSPSYRSVSVENAPDSSGLGYTGVGLRYRLLHGPNWLISAQGLVRIPGRGRSDASAQVGNTSTDFDARLGGAYSTSTMFASAEGGYRFRSGDLPNEFHGDVSVGVSVTDRLLLLGTSTNTFSDGAGQGLFNDDYRYGDLFVSGVYKVSDTIRLQAGYTTTVYGRNALKQHGPLIGVWFEF